MAEALARYDQRGLVAEAIPVRDLEPMDQAISRGAAGIAVRESLRSGVTDDKGFLLVRLDDGRLAECSFSFKLGEIPQE